MACTQLRTSVVKLCALLFLVMCHADLVAVSSAGGELEQIAAHARVYSQIFTACHCVI